MGNSLRRGWTTGACAAAAAKSACSALFSSEFLDPVQVQLPRGHRPTFSLAYQRATHESGNRWTQAAIIKDSGDDPDITNGAAIAATITYGEPGSGIRLLAGKGVGTVQRPGLPIAIGDAAINPAPRDYIILAVNEVAPAGSDITVTVSIEGGEDLAAHTLNPRLGIRGGLSVLGTTGVLIPFSCSAWIYSIQHSIDVARAAGIKHIAASTGRTSEQAVKIYHGLSDEALIDMGDFAGGMLKYLRRNPLPYITIAGGIAKITKLAQGFMDLHSRCGQVDQSQLAKLAAQLEASADAQQQIAAANTVNEAFSYALQDGVPIGDAIACRAREKARDIIRDDRTQLEVLIFDQHCRLAGQAPF